MKEKNVIVLIAVLSLLGTFFLVYGAQGNYLAVIGASVFDGWATQATTSASLAIAGAEEISVLVSDSGNASFASDTVPLVVHTITNLTSGWQINISLKGQHYPSGQNYPLAWTEPEPNTTQAGTTKFEYFEVKVNQSVPNSSYRIFFNLSQLRLGDLPPDNVSLFTYNDTSTVLENLTNTSIGWENLTTEVINGTNDPAQFFGIAPHFSKFLIGQRGPATPGAEPEAPGGGGQTGTPSGPSGGGGGGGAPRKVTAIEKESQEEELPPEPVHISGDYFDVQLVIPKKYHELLAGDELIAELSIINIKKIGVIGVEIEYTIEDRSGKVIWNWIEQKSVENEITFVQKVNLPAEMAPGYYMFFARVRFKDDTALAGYPFKVIVPERVPGAFAFLEGAWVPILFFLVLIALIVLVISLIHDRDKVILALKGHQLSELTRQQDFLNEQRAVIQKKSDANPQLLRTEVHQKVSALKNVHQMQLNEMRRLKAKDDTQQMEQKLMEWKKKGYNTLGLEHRLKGLTDAEIQQLLKKMKKKYGATEEYKNKA